jgi:FtsZ-binding cell division protein ZapB
LAVRLSEKFKKLKSELKRWNVEVFGNLEFRISQLVEQIKILDLKTEERVLTLEEAVCRIKSCSDLWTLLKFKDAQMFQRSRAHWCCRIEMLIQGTSRIA